MTDPNPEDFAALVELAKIVLDGVITTREALRWIRQDAAPLVGNSVPFLAEASWEVARDSRDSGCLIAGLLHEWVVTHADGDQAGLFASGRAFVRAATEVLMARDDNDLYRRAHEAADRMIDSAEPAAVPTGHYVAGMLHLAPYALDPVNNPGEYALGRELRYLRETWSLPRGRATGQPADKEFEELMPEPAVGLGRAVHHLAAAAEGTTGEAKGEALAHLAFAAYSRHLADGSGSVSDVDSWCEEAVALLPPDGEPLACSRLLWLFVLRGRARSVALLTSKGEPPPLWLYLLLPGRRVQRPIPTSRLGVMPDGLVHTVLTGVTVVRLLAEMGLADEAREIVDTVMSLVAVDPDLQAQRLFLDLAAAHCLPDDPVRCRDRLLGAMRTSVSECDLSLAGVAAGRIHALVCGPDATDPDPDVLDAAAESARQAGAPHLSRIVAMVTAYRIWTMAVSADDEPREWAIWLLVKAVTVLTESGNHDLAMLALDRLVSAIAATSVDWIAGVDTQSMCPTLVEMARTVFAVLPEAGCRAALYCLQMLLGRWSALRTSSAAVCVAQFTIFLKGRALAGALAQPGPAPPDREMLGTVVMQAMQKDAARGVLPHIQDVRSFVLVDSEAVIGTFLHDAEQERGSTAVQRQANLKRRAQTRDGARLKAHAAPFRPLPEVQRALPDGAVLLNLLCGVLGTSVAAVHVTTMDKEKMAQLPVGGPITTPFSEARTQTLWSATPEPGLETTRVVNAWLGPMIARMRRELLEDPLHRDVTRAGERELADFAEFLSGKTLNLLAEFAAAGKTQLIVWPHEALYFLPLQLLPFRDGILADYFTVTVLPSVECLFREPPTAFADSLRVCAIASATGGVPAGLPEEPSLHEQAERIAGLFGVRPLTGQDATPTAALEALGTSRYLHLAAHGTQDVDAPLFARLYLAGGFLHAYQVLERDLRGTDLVTLSTCESALLRYDFLDNLHGLAPAFLRAGARAVIAALWPIGPDVAATFFTELYARLASGSTRVDAFRHAQIRTRAQHPNYRDWGAFTYLGA